MSILWVSTGIRQLHATLLVFQGPFQDYLTTFKTGFAGAYKGKQYLQYVVLCRGRFYVGILLFN